MRAILLSTLCVSATGFTSPHLPTRMDKTRCSTPEATLGRRAFAGALIPAVFLGAASAEAYSSAPIRKADQSLIGVSTVEIPAKGEGNKGAGQPPVPIDTSWAGKTSVWGPGGAVGNAGKNGFWAGGESQAEKDTIMKNPTAVAPFKRMVDGDAGYNTKLANP